MNLQEFASLKIGDKIDNPLTGSAGEVIDTSASGIRVVWGPRHARETPFFYSGMTTTWFHWTKAGAEDEKQRTP